MDSFQNIFLILSVNKKVLRVGGGLILGLTASTKNFWFSLTHTVLKVVTLSFSVFLIVHVTDTMLRKDDKYLYVGSLALRLR